jgi:hypothetical protein
MPHKGMYDMSSYLNITAWSLLGFAIAIFYQNCGGSTTAQLKDRGLPGGGLNITTSSSTYDYNFGKIDSEVAHYDDLYDVKSLDLLNPLDQRLFPITYRIAENQKFVLIMVNGHLNPGAILKLNNEYYFASEYQKLTQDFINGGKRALPVWTPQNLQQAKLMVLDDTLSDQKIIPTRTDCVAMNRPGPKGEYRNGALVLQAVGMDMLSFDSLTQSAGRSAKLLWEISLFQDSPAGRCY